MSRNPFRRVEGDQGGLIDLVEHSGVAVAARIHGARCDYQNRGVGWRALIPHRNAIIGSTCVADSRALNTKIQNDEDWKFVVLRHTNEGR